MRGLFAFCLLAIVACGSSTEPGKAGDPSILVTNNLQSDWVYITWKDGQSVLGRDSVAPRTVDQCVRFLAQPDSAYWEAIATEKGSTGTITSGVAGEPTEYFNPSSRPAWSLTVLEGALMLATEVATPC
jgi:hypothetical protein